MKISSLSKVCDALSSQTLPYTQSVSVARSFESHLSQADCAGVLQSPMDTLPESGFVGASCFDLLPKASQEAQALIPKEESTWTPAVEPVAPFHSPHEFINTLMPYAIRASELLGIHPKLLLAQAALETGWGRAIICGANGQPSFNLFNIKAKSTTESPSMRVLTHEYENERWQVGEANFKVYDNYLDSFMDYVALLNHPRYQEARMHRDDPEAYITHLQHAGFATDPNYAKKVLRIYHSEFFRSNGAI